MKTFIWVLIVALGIGLLFVFGDSGTKIKPDLEVGVLHPLDNIKGNASSSVVVMEYSDFECPACRTYYPVMRELTAEFGDRVAFVYRHFPLTGIHPNAEFAARAAQAAAKQGKFWEMHDPTSLNQQGGDIGTQYRSAIYVTSEDQMLKAKKSKEIYQTELDKHGHSEIVTEILSADGIPYWLAEDYHQRYLEKNPNGYDCHSSTGIKYPLKTRI